jgi:hypothetical protein
MDVTLWNDAKPGSFLANEFGITLRAKQDKNTIEAIQTPDKFIENRSAEIATLFAENGPVTKFFRDRRDQLIKTGLPTDLARDMALRQAKAFYEQELEILELSHPDGYAKAFGVAGVKHNAELAKDNVANETVAQYKARKRVKKADKRARKQAK